MYRVKEQEWGWCMVRMGWDPGGKLKAQIMGISWLVKESAESPGKER